MRRALASAFCVLLLGCGGKAILEPGSDGGTGSETSSSGCQPLPGCTSTTSCPAGDGCNTCTCSNGGWACTLLGCTTPLCPIPQPTGGTACTTNGQTCNEGGRCGSSCTCRELVWSCVVPPCPPPVCPPNPPSGTDCMGLTTCDYPTGGCGGTHCSCAMTPQDQGWTCTLAGCDAGSPD